MTTDKELIKGLSAVLRQHPLNISSSRRGTDNGLRNADEIAQAFLSYMQQHIVPLVDALEALLGDTQHRNHKCGGNCPVSQAEMSLANLPPMLKSTKAGE